MFFRFILLVFMTLGSFLYAQPSLAEVKQAVTQNPALLDTPQAQAMMKEKGLTKAEVTQKLNEANSDTANKEAKSEAIENKIDDNTATSETKTQAPKVETLSKRVNPFAMKSNEDLQQELNKKQQALVSNKLVRYSKNFYANKNEIDMSSLPTPDNYIISTGDSLSVHIYGDRNQEYTLNVQNDGTVDIAFIGPVKIGGMEFKDAKEHLINKLKNNFKMSSFTINMSKYSTIQVTLIGEVEYPGIYNVSSFSTAKDLLIAAKGVRDNGSVRDIVIKRDSKIIARLDFYDLLFKGNSTTTTLLKQGDIIIIDKVKTLVSIDGYVSHAAIFELKGNETLDTLIEYAGGMQPNASKLNIKIDRYTNNSIFETFTVPYAKAREFKMKDGDKVYIYPLDFTAQSSINIYGNVIRPGSYRINDINTLNDFFKKSLKDGLKKFFLPQTYFEYGVLKRYSKNLTYETKSFNLSKVIDGRETVNLNPHDEIFIFSQNDIYANAYITTVGKSLVKAGKLQYFSGMTMQDAVNASGISGVLDDKVRLTTYNTADFMPQTNFYSLKTQGKTPLSAYDEIAVYDYYGTHVLEPISINGEVISPVSTFYEEGMNLQNLIDIAGGFSKKAYTKSLTIIRYFVDDTQTRQQKVLNFDLSTTPLNQIMLEPYDEVIVSSILGWDNEDYETVTINGEVHNPKVVKYGDGMTIKDLIILGGGLTKKAYPNEIEVVRYFIDENQTRQREIVKYNIKNKNLSEIKLKAYDEVRIFGIPQWSERKTVVLKGQVKFPGSYTIESGEKLSSVLQRAGGFTNEAFVDGAVFTRDSIRENQVEQYNRSLAKIKRELAVFNAMPANAKKSAAVQSSGNLNEVIAEAEKFQPIGRVSIIIDENLTKFQETEYDLVLQDKDTISIPGNIDTITVFGEVFNPTSFVYNSDNDVDNYIDMASGYSRGADKDRVYVIHADGTSEPIDSGWLSLGLDVQKGDTIVVPLYIKEYDSLEIADSIATIMASFALTVAAVNSLGVI